MSNLRAIKDKARARLHARMRVETFCYEDGQEGTYETVFARVNSEDKVVGDLAGTSLGYAERRETIPKLIFLADEHDPQRGNVYAVGPEEAYQVDTVDPRDGITVSVVATRLPKKDAAKYEYPGC